MKQLALVLLLVVLLIATQVAGDDEPTSAADYAREYGGSPVTYAGILSDDRCERLWELHELDDMEPGYRIAAGDRYNEVCAE